MSCYWTINGIPACASPLSNDLRIRTQCGHATREDAEQDIAACRALYPDFIYRVVEGSCTESSGELWDDPGYMQGVEAVLRHVDDQEAMRGVLIAAGVLPDPEVQAAKEEARNDAYRRQRAAFEAASAAQGL